jgi:hypothetical protein
MTGAGTPELLGLETVAQAECYLSAAAVLSTADDPRHLYPLYFLTCHGIELTLKAYLLSHGVEPSRLRNPNDFGHDLTLCWLAAKQYGLTVTFPDLDDLIRRASEHHKGPPQTFRYNRPGPWTAPLVTTLQAAGGALLAEVFSEVKKRFRASLPPSGP